MSHDDQAVAAIGAAVVATATTGLTDGGIAAPALTALAPAGADEVSAAAAAAFTAEGAEILAGLTAAHQEIARAGATFTEIAGIYAAADAVAADAIARPAHGPFAAAPPVLHAGPRACEDGDR